MRISDWSSDVCSSDLVVKTVRSATTPDFPIIFRFSQWKLQDYNGRLAETPQELEAILAPLVDAGVDLFDASTRVFSMPAFPDAERDSHMGLAGWARKVTGKPTMTVGGVGFSKDLQSSFVEEKNAINNRSEEHTSELQSLMRITYAVICLKNKTIQVLVP